MHTISSLVTEAELGSSVSAEDTKSFLSSVLGAQDADRFRRLVETSRIRQRRVLASYDGLRRLESLEARNALYMEHAVPTAERVARGALAAAALAAREVDALIVTSSTGHSVPTLDQHLATRLDLRPDARCLFLGGLGCAGAVRAIALAGDLVEVNAAAINALVVSVELCSPWLQVEEPSPEDMLSNILFGDGAAAAVVHGGRVGRGAEVLASHTELWPESLGARGATLTQTGFRHFASPALPRLLRKHLRRTVEGFLSRQGVSESDLRFFAVNPSDHRVLESVASVLCIPEKLARPAWAAWEEHGNALSAGPLYVLDALRRMAPPACGELGLAVVLGPGVTCDLALLRWHGDLAS